jgi:hypothetical protein
MNLLNIEQGSHEWFAARTGAATGSRIREALSTLSRASQGYKAGDRSAESRKYMLQLALERITGEVVRHHVTPEMDWGTEHEPHAVRAYEAVTEAACRKVGIAVHPSIPMFMASPDRYIGSDGVLEVKCPTSMVHLEYLRGGVVPELYIPQCLSELACDPSREYLDFVSFDPRFTGKAIKLQIFIAPRMYRSEWAMHIAEIEDGVRRFLAETATLTAELQEMAEKRVL